MIIKNELIEDYGAEFQAYITRIHTHILTRRDGIYSMFAKLHYTIIISIRHYITAM